MKAKSPEDSKTIQTDVVLPADTNSLDNLFGGELLAEWTKLLVLLPSSTLKMW